MNVGNDEDDGSDVKMEGENDTCDDTRTKTDSGPNIYLLGNGSLAKIPTLTISFFS